MLLHQNNSKEIELHFLQTIPFVSFASIRALLICYTVSPILAVLSLHKLAFLANANYDLCLKFVPCLFLPQSILFVPYFVFCK